MDHPATAECQAQTSQGSPGYAWAGLPGAGMTVQLLQGDSLEQLRTLTSATVDLIITSPPYNCRKDYGDFDDQVPWPKYYENMDAVLTECYRLLVPGGVIAINVPGVIRWQADHRYADTWSDYEPDYDTHRRGEKVTGKGRIEPLGFKLYEMMWRHDPKVREPIIWVRGSEGNAISSDF